MEKAGKKLKCKRCGDTATIILEDGRYTVFCSTCQTTELLKTYSIAPQATQGDYRGLNQKDDTYINLDKNNSINAFKRQIPLIDLPPIVKSPYDY